VFLSDCLWRWHHGPVLTTPCYCPDTRAKLMTTAGASVTGSRSRRVRVVEHLAWCAEQGEDSGQARAGLPLTWPANRPTGLITWPPGRDQPCWLGSGRKYKKRCAALQRD
jgi:hypothetical protein